MNYAIKINSLAQSLWPDQNKGGNTHVSQSDLDQIQIFLQSLTLNELHQIIELCSQKALFIILQKSDLITNKYSQNMANILKELNSFFQNWIQPNHPFNLKRSFDSNCLQHHFESSISSLMGKILKEISKSNTQSDWDLVTNFVLQLGQKSNFYQILIILGYFSEMESLDGQIQEYQPLKDILTNYEFEIIPKLVDIVIKNVNCCKQTLEVLELQKMSMNLTLINQNYQNLSNQKAQLFLNEKNTNQLNSNIQSSHHSKIKFLKMNFEILRKVVNFNYQIQFKKQKGFKNQPIPPQKSMFLTKCIGFPDYIIKSFLETDFIHSLFQIGLILINFNFENTGIRISFCDTVLDLLNKIIKTKIDGLRTDLNEKFIIQVLSGLIMLMKKIFDSEKFTENLVVRILRGNINLLKSVSIKYIMHFKEAGEWISSALKFAQKILDSPSIMDLDNYVCYKALCFSKEIIFQRMLYKSDDNNDSETKKVINFGLKIQQIFLSKHLIRCQFLENKNYYSVDNLRSKRDRYFHNMKTIYQIHLASLNSLLQSKLLTINSVQQAANYLLFVSYFVSAQFLNSSFYYFICHNQDLVMFKKLTIGNGLILVNELMKFSTLSDAKLFNYQDSVFLFIQKLLEVLFDHQNSITVTFYQIDINLPSQSSFLSDLSNKQNVLTFIFVWILRIIQLKTEKQKGYEDKFQPYFQTFIKYLTVLINQNQYLQRHELIFVQSELIKYFLVLKGSFRSYFTSHERKFLSQITILLNQQPSSNNPPENDQNGMILFIKNEIKQLLKLLSQNPNDWIGICYEIAGYLQLIDYQKTYFTVITLIGSQFLGKILMSCLQQPNLQKIKLMACLSDSFLDFTEDQKIKNLIFWLEYVNQIFLGWIKCMQLLCENKFVQENWDSECYEALINLLNNENLNFYMLKRIAGLKQITKTFHIQLLSFLRFNLEKKIKNSQYRQTEIFQVLKVIFKFFSEYLLLEPVKEIPTKFKQLISTLISFIKFKLCLINNRKQSDVSQSLEALKSLRIILQFLTQAPSKYPYKKEFIQIIQSFVETQKFNLLSLETQVYKFSINYEKCMKLQNKKSKKSEVDALIKISNLIQGLCGKENHQKQLINHHENILSSSSQEIIQAKKIQSQQPQSFQESIKSLQKQLIWFDIEGEKKIFDY